MGAQFSKPVEKKARIIDTTLREGMQAPGVRLGIAESVEIAEALLALGVDMVECGHPHIGEQEAARVRAVVRACGTTPVLAHARARAEDIDAVKASGARWVGIFAGVNALSRQHRISGLDTETLIATAIRYAKSIGLKVRFTIEDASRTHWDDLAAGYRAAIAAGADRLCLADTVGILCPWDTESLVRRISDEFPGHELEVHLHDDRGMADANALCAARAGAAWISSSVNGVGERCGISDTLLLLVNLHESGLRPFYQGTLLPAASALVQSHSRFLPDARRPLVGRNAFTHVAKLHLRAVAKDEAAYSWLPPEAVGRTTSVAAAILPAGLAQLVSHPEVISAVELRHHRHGPGERYLMLDQRVVSDARQYCIIREVPHMDDYGPGHVDTHRHCVDSLFLVIGREPGLKGFAIEVRLGDQVMTVESPGSVFIPSGVEHSYRVLRGAGLFFNHVLAGDYNSSLLDRIDPPAAIANALVNNMASDVVTHADFSREKGEAREPAEPESPGHTALAFLQAFVQDRVPDTRIAESTEILDVFDSLLFLDFFVHLEDAYGDQVSLDDISLCKTFGDVALHLGADAPRHLLAAAG